jgi:predicted DNA-binding transcriptional regulator AlpA
MVFESEKKFVRFAEVVDIVALGSTTIRSLIATGTFPQPVKLTDHRIAWYLHEVQAWMSSRPRRNE